MISLSVRLPEGSFAGESRARPRIKARDRSTSSNIYIAMVTSTAHAAAHSHVWNQCEKPDSEAVRHS
eukprot:2726004-Rhodomonas_salina.3